MAPKCRYQQSRHQGGEVLGTWLAVGYDPRATGESERYEFVMDGQDAVMFAKGFAALDYQTRRDLALSMLARAIREWHEAQSF